MTTNAPRFLLLALMAVTAAALSGCVACQPLLEVRNCLDHQCQPSPDAMEVVWSSQHAADWPQIDALLDATNLGEHEHRKWDQAQEKAFWDYWGATGDQRELIVQHEGQTFRIRVLTCD